jgi:hypothetical protein
MRTGWRGRPLRSTRPGISRWPWSRRPTCPPGLREALGDRGRVFETARDYRRAVDERLFRLGEERYGALMDTLIQLRQPQLSKKPDEGALSNALSEALPPLSQDLISEVADALSQLDDDRRQLEEYQALARAVGSFERRYRIYAGTRRRREAAGVRAAQTEFDNASRDRNEAEARLEAAEAEEAVARAAVEEAERVLARARARLDTLYADPANRDANRLGESAREAEARRRALTEAEADATKAESRCRREADETRRLEQRTGEAAARLADGRGESAAFADAAGMAAAFAWSPLAAAGTDALLALTVPRFEQACAGLRALAAGRRKDIALIRTRLEAWGRVQKEVGNDLADLRRALSARGHREQTDYSDGSLVVRILYQGRLERPDRLKLSLEEEIGARNALLRSWRTTCRRRSPTRSSAWCRRPSGSATRSTRSCASAQPPPACAIASCGSRSARRRGRR